MCRQSLHPTHILMSVHAGQVQWRIAIVVLSVSVGLVMQQQQLQVAPQHDAVVRVESQGDTKRGGQKSL